MLDMTTLAGALVVGAGGLIMGSSVWPFKLMRKYQFEHWWLISALAGLVVMPWAITLLACPHPFQSLRSVPISAILLGNLFALGWGIANVLCGLCFVRWGRADRRDPGGPGRSRPGPSSPCFSKARRLKVPPTWVRPPVTPSWSAWRSCWPA